jgi:hypothetical protein
MAYWFAQTKIKIGHIRKRAQPSHWNTMTEEIPHSEYNNLLRQAKGSAKYWIPKLCDALRNEDSKMSNEDIRDRIEKDCIETWQKPTIRDALPEEYKDKQRVEQGKKGREKQLVSVYVGKTQNQPDESRANDQAIEQKEPYSRTFETIPALPKPTDKQILTLDSRTCKGWPGEKYFVYKIEHKDGIAIRMYSTS